MARVIAIIGPDGVATFKVEGVAGPGCTDITKALQKALGTTTSDKKTAEYFESRTEATVRKEVA